MPRGAPTLESIDDAIDQNSSPAPPPLSRRWAFLAASSPVPTVAGIVVVAAGFVLIAIAWSKIAAETSVGLQMPYLVSAGMTGLALVIVGVLIVNIAVKRQEAAERRQQMEQLAEILSDLKRTLGR
jgi:hypothetical protein